jgi:signal transduction histidine kinase
MSEEKKRHFSVTVLHFITFFLLMCFIVTCCMELFLQELQAAMDLHFQAAQLHKAAVLTFGNVVLLSLLCCAVDGVRRHYMVHRPVKKITQAVEKVMEGDLSVRIEKTRSIDPDDSFSTIIDYFNRMIQELSGMETLRTDFISNVSHELKTPLAVMQNYGTMLQQPDLPERERLEYAKAITDSARSLANMVGNILKLNKIENQTIYPDTHVYDLGAQLGECLVGLEEVWDKKGLEVEADLDEDVRVKADPELLTLVWNNLFSNAIKFTDPGGKISLSLKARGDIAVVDITDTGCGISSETGKYIFEKFYQGDTSHATQGNGLGLALVKRVMDLTGGNISVVSEVGVGSTFTVKLRREQGGEGKAIS